MIKRVLLAAATAVTLAPVAQAMTFGVVDTQVLQKTPIARKAEARVQQAQTALSRELQVRSQKLDEAQKRKASPEELAKMRQQFEKELQDLRSKGEADLASATDAFKREVDKAVKVVAAEKKLDVVLVKGAMLYGGTDITSDVEKQLTKLEKADK